MLARDRHTRWMRPRYLAALATLTVLAGCTTAKPATQPAPVVATQAPSPTPSPTLAAAVALDEPAHTACKNFFGTHADQETVDPHDPLLPVIAASAIKSANFSVRFDGQRLDTALKAGGYATVQVAAADLYKDCKILDALK